MVQCRGASSWCDGRGFASGGTGWECGSRGWKEGTRDAPLAGDPSAVKRSPAVGKEVQFGNWAKPKVMEEQVSSRCNTGCVWCAVNGDEEQSCRWMKSERVNSAGGPWSGEEFINIMFLPRAPLPPLPPLKTLWLSSDRRWDTDRWLTVTPSLGWSPLSQASKGGIQGSLAAGKDIATRKCAMTLSILWSFSVLVLFSSFFSLPIWAVAHPPTVLHWQRKN